jgi:hypothetical protein
MCIVGYRLQADNEITAGSGYRDPRRISEHSKLPADKRVIPPPGVLISDSKPYTPAGFENSFGSSFPFVDIQ